MTAPAAVPFEPAHLRRLAPGRHEVETLCGMHPGALAHIALPGPAIALVEGGRVLGCAGVTPEGADGIVWSTLSDELRCRPLVLHRAAKRFLAAEAPRFRALRAFVRTGFAAGDRWVRTLGFRHLRDRADFLGTGRTFSEYEMSQATPFIAIASAVAAGAKATANARAQSRQASYQADILRRQAEHEARILQAEEQALRRKQSKELAAQRATLAGRGVELTAGSALLVQEQAAADAEFDALLQRAIGGARLFRSRAEAGGAGLRASAARTNAAFTAGTSLLTAAGTTSKQWPEIKKQFP